MWCERKTAALVCQQSLPEIHCAHTWSSNYFYTVQFLLCPGVFKSYPTLNIGFISFFKLVWLQPVLLIVSSPRPPPIPSHPPIFPVTLTGITISRSLVDLETLVNIVVQSTLLQIKGWVFFPYIRGLRLLKELFPIEKHFILIVQSSRLYLLFKKNGHGSLFASYRKCIPMSHNIKTPDRWRDQRWLSCYSSTC